MKGVYWDHEEDAETHRAENMANLRLFSKFPAHLQYSGSRMGSHSPMVRSRAGSLSGSIGSLGGGAMKKASSISCLSPNAGQLTTNPAAAKEEKKMASSSKLNNMCGPAMKRVDSTGSISGKLGVGTGSELGNRSRASSFTSLLGGGEKKSGSTKGSVNNLLSKKKKMGNASSAPQAAVYHGFDSLPPRDVRSPYTDLLKAASNARTSRRPTPSGRILLHTNSMLIAEYLASSRRNRSRSNTMSTSAGADETGGEDDDDTTTKMSMMSDDSDYAPEPIPTGINGGSRDSFGKHNSSSVDSLAAIDPSSSAVSMELKDIAARVVKGDLSDIVERLLDNIEVKLFVSSNGTDFEWERNTLIKDVWPFLAKLCQVLDLDFEPLDLNWNVYNPAIHENKETQRSIANLAKCLNESAGPAFLSLLGDKYGAPSIPTTINAKDFEKMCEFLTSHNRSRDVNELFGTWYVRDDNAVPPVYVLRPVTPIMPSYDIRVNPEAYPDALAAWVDVRYRLASLLKTGALALGEEGLNRRYGRSLTELEVFQAYGSEGEKFFGFQRTMLDIKRKAVENAEVASKYIDMIGSQVDKETVQDLARLRAKVKATRFYAIPWRVDNLGLAPDGDKAHGVYLKSFCDDVARILAESCLKTFMAKPYVRDWDPLPNEVAKHASAVRKEFKSFVGRQAELNSIQEFLDDGDKSVCPSGVGKTALLAKTAEIINLKYTSAALVFRLVGVTPDSLDGRGLMRTICAQIVRVFGDVELKARVLEAAEAVQGALEEDAGLRDLVNSLDNWPPTSYEGLKAALPFVFGLASESHPIFLLLDALDELSLSDDARDLDWLPQQFPHFTKVILTTAPPSNLNPTYGILTSLYSASPFCQLIEVPFLNSDDIQSLFNTLQTRDSRKLTEEQMSSWLEKCQRSKMPLYIHTSWNLIASRWMSEDPMATVKRSVAAESGPGLLEDFLESLEGRLGPAFVGRALGYITAAKRGLSKMELADVLSCDEEVLQEVFKVVQPPMRRIPPLMIVRLLEELGLCIVERQVDGVSALFWAHEQFKRVAMGLYLDRERAISIHASLADYWEGKWAKTPKPFYDPKTQTTKSEPRYIMDQSPLIAGRKPNGRRLAALVWHQLEGGVTGFQEAAKTLQDLTHIGGAIEAGLIWDLLASFRAALAKESADGSLLPQLIDYYRFLLAHADILVSDPSRLLPAAANMYQGSIVADDARKWISKNAPGFCWAEWVNRPSARGEPLATLKGTDNGGSPMDRMLVTGRDTFEEMVVVVGVTVDGRRGAALYDTAEIQAAASGGGLARLVAKTVIATGMDDNGEAVDDEADYPLICVFSRSGTKVLAAGRSMVCMDGSTLETLAVGLDSELPEGDVITAAAWTKEDGCIVTSSDGQEPGRLVLWNAMNFSVIRVIKTQYPRQPFTSSYSHLGFWDEYRSLFILLDADELAEDAESGLSLQYIPSKPHTDPPADGPARFAIAHKASLVLVAADDGKGYVLLDFKAKKPLARLSMNVDSVRQVALSSDGMRVAVVPNDSKVVFIFALQMPEKGIPSLPPGEVIGFRQVGTVLAVDPSLQPSDPSCTSCMFSRSDNTILTDGAHDSVLVWDSRELGDHSTLRFRSVLSNLSQGLVPILSSASGQPVGWAVTAGPIDMSLADASGRSCVRTHQITLESNRKARLPLKDIILAISSHPTKPLLAAVTDLGILCVLVADKMPDEPGTWVGSLWSSAFRQSQGKDGAHLFSFNVKAVGAQSSPTCVAFLPSTSQSQGPQPLSNQKAQPKQGQIPNNLEVIRLATGHEDGAIFIWEWKPSSDMLHPEPIIMLQLNGGRITSLTTSNTGSRHIACTLDDTAVILWDGVNDDPESALVLIPPADSEAEASSSTRLSSVSMKSLSNQARPWNVDRPCAVAFSRTKDHLLATGSANAGIITIWNTVDRVRRVFVMPSTAENMPAPIMAIAWA
ncbi:hypothetical protein HDV05_006024, partial [Chytridiales sp. JEL 0842]